MFTDSFQLKNTVLKAVHAITVFLLSANALKVEIGKLN